MDAPRAWEPEGVRFAGAFALRRIAAAAWLDEAAASAGVALAPAAGAALVDALIHRLCACGHTALDAERRRGGAAPEDCAAELARPDAWARFAGDYPAVARLCDTSDAAWRRRTADLLTHVARDADALGADRPAIDDVCGHSERLQARRTTLTVTLSGGRRWVHRTKSLAMAAWFMDLCAAIDALGPSAPLHTRPILVRPDHSWDSFVQAAPCPNDAIRRYFVRAGMLVRLLERLAAVDFHVQNVLLAGEHPVLVDIETLFAAWPDGASPAARALVRSPLRSAFLTAHVTGEPGRAAAQAGGLHPGGAIVLPFRSPRLRAVDDPVGGLEHVFEIEEVAATLPAPLGANVDAILSGYDEMDGLLARMPGLAGRLAAASTLPARTLLSSGATYHILLHASLEPSLLRSDATRDAWLARLPIDAVERAGVRDLEYPRPGGLVGLHPALAPEPPFTPAERARRADIIRTAVALRDDRPAPPRAVPSPRATATAHAVGIGDFILAVRFPGPEWHGAQWLPWAGVRALDVLGPDLLSGHAGVALVLASLFEVTRLPRFRDAALGALDKVPGSGPEPWLGAFHGLGGAIYALARCGAALGEPALSDRAATLVRAVPRTPLARGPWDVTLGAAGFLLGAAACGGPPRDAVAAVRAAWDRGLPPSPCPPGGVPACLPDVATGVAVALARAGEHVAAPADGRLAWRLELDAGAAAEAARRLPGADPLDDADLALAAHRATGDAAFLAHARSAADRLIAARRDTGWWLPATSVAERHHLSAVTGLGAVALVLLAADAPEAIPAPRRLR